MLHGGGSRGGSRTPVSPTQPSALRMHPVAWALALRGGTGLAVRRQLNSWRGWDPEHSPVEDTLASLARVREAYGEVPVALVGHSLGGRTALLTAARDGGVGCVVALNPWVQDSDLPDASGLAGTRVLVVHGDADRIADLGRARRIAERAGRVAEVELEVVPGGKHGMLGHPRAFDGRAAAYVRDWVATLPR